MTEDDYYIERHIEPCPFCGGKSSPERNWRDSWVECDTCGARGQTFQRNYWLKAIQAWNNRMKRNFDETI